LLLEAFLFSQTAVSAFSQKREKQLLVDDLMTRTKLQITRVVYPAGKLDQPVLTAVDDAKLQHLKDKFGFTNKRAIFQGSDFS
jgi:hypothetical protein